MHHFFLELTLQFNKNTSFSDSCWNKVLYLMLSNIFILITLLCGEGSCKSCTWCKLMAVWTWMASRSFCGDQVVVRKFSGTLVTHIILHAVYLDCLTCPIVVNSTMLLNVPVSSFHRSDFLSTITVLRVILYLSNTIFKLIVVFC